MKDPWSLYLIKTAQGALYVGISNNVPKRFHIHQAGGPRGAKFLKGKGPLKLVFVSELGTKSRALKAEIRLKNQSAAKKKLLASGQISLKELGVLK